MQIGDPTPLPSRYQDQTAFRLHQRFEAEVMQVSGERVVLSVAGVPVVARLTSPEQAAILLQQRFANFQVLESGAGEMRVRLLQGAPEKPAAFVTHDDPVARLLQMLDLPADEVNLALARQAMLKHLPVTSHTLQNLRAVIEQALQAKPDETQSSPLPSYAAAIKAAVAWAADGRPLTPEALRLLLKDLPDMGALLTRLAERLAQVARPPAAPEAQQAAQQALAALDGLLLDVPPGEDFPTRLKTVLDQLGRSPDGLLQNSPTGEAAGLLPRLAALRVQLSDAAPGLCEALDGVLDKLRLQALSNTPLEAGRLQSGPDSWRQIELPVRLPAQPPDLQPQPLPVRLRVQRRPHDPQPAGLPDATRLVFDVEITPGQTMQFDLSITGRQVLLCVQAGSPRLCEAAQAELPQFDDGLEKLGYTLQASSFGVGAPPAAVSDAPRLGWEA